MPMGLMQVYLLIMSRNIFFILLYLFKFFLSLSNTFGARRIKIYSPYVIINQTGISLEFKSSTAFIGSDQMAAGQSTESVILFCIESLFILLFHRLARYYSVIRNQVLFQERIV